MLVLAVTSQKGGSGKTTLSGHIAVQAERSGAGPVALVDTDPQGSLAKWWNARASDSPMFVRTSVARLPQDLARLEAAGTRLVVIDTPPAITATIVEVVGVSDLVLIPIRPSPHDLRAASATIELVESLGRPLVFVVNGATARARITTEAVLALSQHGTVAASIIHHRTDFAASMIDGRTVMELPRSARSAAEIVDLWEYLRARFERTCGAVLGPPAREPALAGGVPLPPAGPRPDPANLPLPPTAPRPEPADAPAPQAGGRPGIGCGR